MGIEPHLVFSAAAIEIGTMTSPRRLQPFCSALLCVYRCAPSSHRSSRRIPRHASADATKLESGRAPGSGLFQPPLCRLASLLAAIKGRPSGRPKSQGSISAPGSTTGGTPDAMDNRPNTSKIITVHITKSNVISRLFLPIAHDRMLPFRQSHGQHVRRFPYTRM